MKGRSVGLVLPPALTPNGNSADFEYDFHYTVDGSGGWTSTIDPGFTATFLTGVNAGVTVTNPGGRPGGMGLIGNNAEVLTLASVVPYIEERNFSNGNLRFRICHRSRVLTRMRHGNQH